MTSEYLRGLAFFFDWCVLGFLCISGYLHARSDSRREKGFGEFILQRLNRLLIPFVLLVFVYAVVWQFLGTLHFSSGAARIPFNFFDKLATSFWPVNQRAAVAEQLYYLPLLFGASVVFMVVRQLGFPAVWAMIGITFVVGLRYFPGEFTEFRLGSFIWAICFYASGYLLFYYRTKGSHVRLTLIIATLILTTFGGWHGLVGTIPLWLLGEEGNLKLGALPGLPSLGEAAGTIYIYHTPFIVQTLVVASTHLSGWKFQLIGALGAGVISIAVCFVFHHLLKNTPAKVILM